MSRSKIQLEKIKKEHLIVSEKIEKLMLQNETNPKLDKLNTRQHELDIEIDFYENVIGGQ